MKIKKIFKCSNCGAEYSRWQGKCNSCNNWESIVEVDVDKNSLKLKSLKSLKGDVYKLNEITKSQNYRIKTKINELDRVLGGGIIPGSIVLIGGDPGIGKSTLTLQMVGKLAEHSPLYITGEESLEQIKYRSIRLKDVNKTEIGDKIYLMAETSLEVMIEAIKTKNYGVIVVDSIQSIHSELVDSTSGSINQVRECTNALMSLAKKYHIPIFIIGHVTKDGIIAGPKILEHLVDTVLHFEGEKNYSFRILRSLKNRYGSTNEIGVFDMKEDGLVEVANISELFLSNYNKDESGISIVACLEGTRPLLLEVQALVTPTGFSVPQRTATGFDLRRLQMIIAVLEKRLGAKFFKHDVFINIAGGVYMNDTSLDLGIAASLISSLRDTPIDSSTVLIGEIGLTGEVRAVSHIEQRISEAEKLGFKKILLPKHNLEKISKKYNCELVAVDRISLALTHLLS